MKVVFVTHCDSWLYESFGCRKMINSFKYFHPNIEIIHLNENDINKILLKAPNGFCRWSVMPLTMLDAKKITNADIVVHLDSDSIVLCKLEEILVGDYDVASVRNDNDENKNDETRNRPYPIRNIPNHLYMNCGCVAVKGEEFLYDWININKLVIDNYGSIKKISCAEQGTFNIIFHNGKYKSKILDDVNNNLLYGASANYNFGGKYPLPESCIKNGFTCSNWESWKELKLINEKVYFRNKQVKILHKAGGGDPKNCEKFTDDLFSEEVLPFIKKITS